MSTLSAPSLRLPAFFGDHMILQRDKPIRLFGEAMPFAEVTVDFLTTQDQVKAGRDGRWSITLPPRQAGGPFSFTLVSGSETIVINDVLIGDVWFCSGQSNMEMKMERCKNPEADIRNACYSQIRYFESARIAMATPQSGISGQWTVCAPDTVGQFSGVAYYFAREVHRKTGVPVGLINSSWGSTPIEAWMPSTIFAEVPQLRPLLAVQRQLNNPSEALRRRLKLRYQKWEKEHISIDPGNKGERRGWARSGFNDKRWKTMSIPGAWEGKGLLIDGAVWFRRRVKIPKHWRGRALRVELGSLDDFDETYFDGVKIGATDEFVENAYKHPRDYAVPAELVKSSSALLAVRIFDRFGSGGFTGTPEKLRLSCPDFPRDASIPLKGKWRYKVEWAVDRRCPSPAAPALPEPRAQLSLLYNGMIHPFIGFPIRGFLWYQGESNASRAAHYSQLFPRMITAWRGLWNDAALPFYFVQLANFRTRSSHMDEDAWAEVREAQGSALSLDHVGMAVAIDLGEEADIHPKNKRDVGRRLARLALSRTYGKKMVDSGPLLREVKKRGTHFEICFDHAGKGLRARDGKPLRGFFLAGKNRKWHRARARIHGTDAIIVTAREVPAPVALRYAWASHPDCNLVNSARLPASPFRTDKWPRLTDGEVWPF